MNTQGSNNPDIQPQFSSGSRQKVVQQQQMSRNFKPSVTSNSPTSIQRKNLYQAQMQIQLQTQQLINLPAVNQSRSERSLEVSAPSYINSYINPSQNTSGYGGSGAISQIQRMNMGALTARAGGSQQPLSQVHIVQNQQMIPSNYSNNPNAGGQQQSQNDKIKSYSRKLAKLVSSGVSGGGGSNSNTRTPNGKKKLKTSHIGGINAALGSSINPSSSIVKALKSGQNTSRGTSNPSMLTSYHQQPVSILNTARPNLNLTKGQQNTTFDIDEHIKNVMKSVERRNKQYSYGNTNMMNTQGVSSYLQSTIGGSKTARNHVTTQLHEYSPEPGASLTKSPRNQYNPNMAMFPNGNGNQPPSQKTTIFSNFSNNTYFIGQAKKGGQSTSLTKKNSYQGGVLASQNSIMIPKNMNASGSQSRKRGSVKRDTIQMIQKTNQSSRQESELFSATQRSIRHHQNTHEEGNTISIRKKRSSLGTSNQNQPIPSNVAISFVKKNSVNNGAQTSRINTSSQGRHNLSSQYVVNQGSGKKKQQNWFSPPSQSHINPMHNMSSSSNPGYRQLQQQQQILSALDNNSSTDKHSRASQFVSPRSFLNKSGGTTNQSNVILSAQANPASLLSLADHRNPLLLASYDAEDLFHNQQALQTQQFQALAQLPLFRNFAARKYFQKWRRGCTRMQYDKNRQLLVDQVLWGKSQSFGEYHRAIMSSLSSVREMSLIGDIASQSKVFNEAVASVKSTMEKLHAYIVKSNTEYERRLKESSSVGRRSSIQAQTDPKQAQKPLNTENQRIINQRCTNFDRMLQMVLTALYSALGQFLKNNCIFQGRISISLKFAAFSSQNSQASSNQHHYQTHSEYYLQTTPPLKTLSEQLKSVFEDSEKLVFGRKVIECFNKLISLFLNKSSQKWELNSFFSLINQETGGSEGKREVMLAAVSREIDEIENVIRRFDDLKQVIQFEERWNNQQQSSAVNGFTADMESNYETWSLMEKFQALINQIPQKPMQLQHLTLDFKALYLQLSKIPQKVNQQIERKVASGLDIDTQALISDLSKAYDILKQSPQTLNIFVEQVNTIKLLNETMAQLSTRHDSIQKLSLLCRTENKINIKDSVQSQVRELQSQFEHLPVLIRNCQDRLDLTRPSMEHQMRQSCQTLSAKIQTFEKKYMDHYIDNASKLQDTQNTLSELKYRQKMIDEIKSKVELYRECINIMGLQTMMTQADITCFKDYEEVEKLHQYTLKMWGILEEWRGQKSALLQRPFHKINFSEVNKLTDEALSFFEQKLSEDAIFKSKLSTLSNTISSEISEMQLSLFLLRDLKKECIKKKHWTMIFSELGMESLMKKDDFTLQELQQRVKIYSYQADIRDIIAQAEIEYEFEKQLSMIKDQMNEKLRFKLTDYKSNEGSAFHILSEFDIVQSQLEEFQIILKRGTKAPSLTDVEVKDQFISTLKIVDNLLNTVDKIIDAQKITLTLDAIFSHSKIQRSLSADFTKYSEMLRLFKLKVIGVFKEDSSVKNLQEHIASINETLEKISTQGTLVQKSVEDYIEAKRLAFPRFFFMTDKQFLDFIDMAEQNLDFSHYINLLFPGASKVFLDQPLQSKAVEVQFKVPPPMVNDLSQVKSELIDFASLRNEPYNSKRQSRLPNQKEMRGPLPMGQGVLEIYDSNLLSDQGFSTQKSKQANPKPSQVLGLVSQMNELFLFEKKVPYQQLKPEVWLQGAETSMQETLGKLINYAVNTFPKQSLDEWILDYPQQVILSTIHLILTHEINELFEEMRKEKDPTEGGRRNSHQDGDDSEEDYTGMTHKTPDTRDLIKNSQISHRTTSQHVSQKSSIRFLAKRDEYGNAGTKKVSSQQQNSKRNQSSSQYSSQQHQRVRNQGQRPKHASQYMTAEGIVNPNDFGDFNYDEEDDMNESEMEALDLSRERKRFAANMFGSDFDVNLVADNKDDTMRILQEKSFRGLFLRLQFWINQICKSLHTSKQSNQEWSKGFEKDLNNLNAPEAPGIKTDLHPVQRIVMQTIINFLSYMRDVVYELKYKKVDNLEDFEWQKQMRLTWNGKDSGCKVDCGAWTTQQANEYYGAKMRVPLSPLTNKYFVFISAAFREKSAVLFRCVPSHDYCGDIFQEFSTICSVPFKEYACNPKLSMKSLMQFLNGAALASTWIFFEHIDKLDYVHLQTFNKEIQMVQQQFIIAELSQDSSVITAHITVGNQSISQCQRSIERIREQASLERESKSPSKKTKDVLSPIMITNVIAGIGDIKIEDNLDDLDYEQSPSRFNDDDSMIQAPSHRQPLHHKQQKRNLENNNHMLQNLSDLALDEDGNVYDPHQNAHGIEDEDYEELKLDEQINNNTIGGGQSKVNNQNKVCFGVFASVSHTFNLKKEKWASEISNALQSAFRVLSLTRPEMPVITTMLLKSEGFSDYKRLGQNINEVFSKVSEYLQLNDRDDSFSLTVRDIRRMMRCASVLLDTRVREEGKKEVDKQIKPRNEIITYSMEKKTKTQILKEMDQEDEREIYSRAIRQTLEHSVIYQVLNLFLLEKLQSYQQHLKLSDATLKESISSIIAFSFGPNSDNISPVVTKDSVLTKQLDAIIKKSDLRLKDAEIAKLKLMAERLTACKPICLIGKEQTGKSKNIKLIAEQLLKKKLIHFNPTVVSSYRDLYGIYDPISTTQQIISQQLGQVQHSIFSVLKQQIEKDSESLMVISGEHDNYFSEVMIPYFEHHSFQDYEASQSKHSLLLTLPNGIQVSLKENIPIIVELRDLSQTSPRFISSLQVINMPDSFDMKNFSFRLKSKLSKILTLKCQTPSKQINEIFNYVVDQILLPTINELKKTKHLQSTSLVSLVQWCLNVYKSYLSEIKVIQNLDMTMTKITVAALSMGVGSALTPQGRQALEDILQSLKQQLGIRQSLFTQHLSVDTLTFTEFKPYNIIDSDIIVNPNLLRASNYAKMMLTLGKDFHLSGASGTQKSTVIRYLQKQHNQEICSRVQKIPITCFLTQRSMIKLLKGSSGGDSQKPVLIIMEDMHVAEKNNVFKPTEYIQDVRLNGNRVFTCEQIELLQLTNQILIITSSQNENSYTKSNSYKMDIGQQEAQDFLKIFIHRKLQIQPSMHQQLSTVILKTFTYLHDHNEQLSTSSIMSLSQNLSVLNNLLTRLSSSQNYNAIELFMIEFQRCVTDRFIYPNIRAQVFERIISFIKQDFPTHEQIYTPQSIDSLINLQQGSKLYNTISELKDLYDYSFSTPICKQMAQWQTDLKRPNTHYVIAAKPGSRILEGLRMVCDKIKVHIMEPEATKFRDSQNFILRVNSLICESLKLNKRHVVLIRDAILSDLSYIDYLSSLVQSIKEATVNNSLSQFNALDVIIGSDLRQRMLEIAQDQHNQQISHSPHSGISSPASPSSLTAQITDSQLLMTALNKISQNVHIVISIQNLQNYHQFISSYSQIESTFQVAFIPDELYKNENIHGEIQQWIHSFTCKQVYESTLETHMNKQEHAFNGQVNTFFIPDHKLNNIFQDGNFEDSSYIKTNQELNLTIPQAYSQSEQRFTMFKEVHQKIKSYLYATLAKQKQYLTTYYQHYQQLQQEFMKKILTKDQTSVSKNHIHVFSLLSVQDKIEKIQQQLKLKDSSSKQLERNKLELNSQISNIKDEMGQIEEQSESRINVYIGRLKGASSNEIKSLGNAIQNGQLSEIDGDIVKALEIALQSKKPITQFLLAQSDFHARLQTIVKLPFPDIIAQKYQKSIQRKITSSENEKQQLFLVNAAKLLNELSRKTQYDKKLAALDIKLKALQDQLSLSQSTTMLYETQMLELREEVEDLIIKEKNMKQELRDILRRIDLKEVKSHWNEHKLKSLLKYAKKSETKLDKVKIRMKNIEGDSLILAASVVYLGPLSVGERMELRKQLAERLLTEKTIEVSEYWQNSASEQIHSKYFRKIIQSDLGLKPKLFNCLSHLFIDSLFSEFLFTYFFCPTIPVIYDAVGIYQQELTEEILKELDGHRVKVLFGSDYMAQEKIKNTLEAFDSKKSRQLIYLNDLNDYSKLIQGKAQDQSILHHLPHLPQTRVSGLFTDNDQVSIPQLTLFSANCHFNLNSDYLASSTVYNATFVNKNEAWIDIKQILLKHFLPDNYQKLSMIKQQTQILRTKLLERQKAFEQLFIRVKNQAVEEKDHKALEEVIECYSDIKQLDEDYQQYNQAFHNLINEHPLLASYSNIFVILYFALKEMSKFTEEITYSWKTFTKVIDMIIAKIIRDLTMNLKNKENEDSDGEGQDQIDQSDGLGRQKKKKDKEFTIDEEFFHSVIMPSIYSTIVAGIKQEHVSLFNLIFSLEIALKKTTVNQEDKDFFIQRFFKIKNCYDWRLNPHKPSTIPSGFADPHQRIRLQEYMTLKRDILKVYPDLRKLYETIEIKIGKEFTFKEANNLLYHKLFKQSADNQQWKDLPLIKKINVGFICPDDEWRSKICQFVYEELTTIFDFSEDLNKLHNFIKTASWSIPVALFTSNSINIVNTVCSIASYYGVGLEVLRTDYQQSIKKQENYYANNVVNENLQSALIINDKDKPLSNEAACIHYEDIDAQNQDRVLMQKENYQRMFSKDELEIDDKQITQNQSSIQLIEKCAENGTWVLISTLKFPSFWYKISRKLEKMARQGKILNTFRLFFDLQGYSLQEIPESFLFTHSVKFYLTEKNNEDMEGFNDVWANILNDDLLNAKDLHNVPVLEAPSDMAKINLVLESNIMESSMESMVPQSTLPYQKDGLIAGNSKQQRKTVKDDKITYSMSQYQSKDSIILPQIFTAEHMRDIMLGGNDLKSPHDKHKIPLITTKGTKRNIEEDISEISNHNRYMSSGLLSNTQSLLMDDMSRIEGALLSELNQAFARKMSSINKEEEKKQQRIEMIKKPAPNHKRQQPPQKQ